MGVEAEPRSIAPPVVLGSYELHGAIAAGGMATVHLARVRKTGRIVAVKRLRPELADDPNFVTMFLDEARLAGQIVHENVVRTLDVVEQGSESYIVMEYVEGDTLSRLLRTYAPPAFDVIARVALDLLRGLHASHVARGPDGSPLGVVHRDVSPQNVLVDVHGLARVIDFGVAKAHGRMQLTRDGEIKGKLGYMAPEQLEGQPTTIRSDIYAAAVVLWELLTGKRLFRGDNEGVVVTRILRGEITPPTEMWRQHARHTLSFFAKKQLEALDALTMRALALRPENRFETAAAMADELERALPASERLEVATWVKTAARDLLESRATVLAQVEASSGVSVRSEALPPSAEEEEANADEGPTEVAPTSGVGPTTTSFALTEGGDPSLAIHDGPEADLIGRTIARGALVLEARIGAGGGGVVYRARYRERPAHAVAVKVLHDSARRDKRFCDRFHAEALAASNLDHVNIVRVLDFGQEADGLLYIIMPLLEGSSLRDVIRAERQLPLARAVDIMTQVCAALGHAHERGVVHRDVKPSNIMLVTKRDDDDRPIEVAKVCDFGVAIQRAGSADGAMSAAPRLAGTLEYMSPEQCRGETVDARSDVYSCGVVLYELLTGRRPFRGRSRADIASQHISASPTLPSRFLADDTPRLDAVVLRALAKYPENRQASMTDLRRALRSLVAT